MKTDTPNPADLGKRFHECLSYMRDIPNKGVVPTRVQAWTLSLKGLTPHDGWSETVLQEYERVLCLIEGWIGHRRNSMRLTLANSQVGGTNPKAIQQLRKAGIQVVADLRHAPFEDWVGPVTRRSLVLALAREAPYSYAG